MVKIRRCPICNAIQESWGQFRRLKLSNNKRINVCGSCYNVIEGYKKILEKQKG